jgi:polyhydroxyalkanoate synthesis regulator phasin
MKAKTLLELVALSTTLYTISKETQLMEKLGDWSEKGKDKINEFMKDKMVNDDGKEMEFTEKLAHKAIEVKEQLEEKIGEMITVFYEKVNIAHTDQIEKMEAKIKKLTKDLALAESRIDIIEKKKS